MFHDKSWEDDGRWVAQLDQEMEGILNEVLQRIEAGQQNQHQGASDEYRHVHQTLFYSEDINE